MVREWTEAIERDYSHPCIIVWVPFNESWGVPNLTLTQAHRNAVEALYHLTRTLDPTRPVIGNDGWEASATDILGIHDYDCDPEKLARALRGHRSGAHPVRPAASGRAHPDPGRLPAPRPADRADRIRRHRLRHASGTPDEGTWGYSRVDHGRELPRRCTAACWRWSTNTFMFSGFCYTQFADTFQEANGLLNADRTPKMPLEVISALTRNVQLKRKAGGGVDLDPS